MCSNPTTTSHVHLTIYIFLYTVGVTQVPSYINNVKGALYSYRNTFHSSNHMKVATADFEIRSVIGFYVWFLPIACSSALTYC